MFTVSRTVRTGDAEESVGDIQENLERALLDLEALELRAKQAEIEHKSCRLNVASHQRYIDRLSADLAKAIASPAGRDRMDEGTEKRHPSAGGLDALGTAAEMLRNAAAAVREEYQECLAARRAR